MTDSAKTRIPPTLMPRRLLRPRPSAIRQVITPDLVARALEAAGVEMVATSEQLASACAEVMTLPHGVNPV